MIFQNTEFKRTNNFIYLLDLIAAKDSDFSEHYDSLIELEGFVVDIRYPNESIFLTKDKVENEIKIAKNIRDFVTDKLNISIDYNEIIDKYGLSVILYIQNGRYCCKFKGCSPIQLLCNLTGMKPAIGYYSDTNRCVSYK